MPEIKVTADVGNVLIGFKQMQAEMDKLIQKANHFSSAWRDATTNGPAGFNAKAGSGAGGAHGAGPRRPGGVYSGNPGGYNMNTPSGYAQYYENVVMPAMPMLSNMGRNGKIGAGPLGVNYQPRATSPVTDEAINTWMTALGGNLRNLDTDVRRSYLNAVGIGSAQETTAAAREFYGQYGAQLGGPKPSVAQTPIGSRLMQHFTNNLGGRGLGSSLMSGVKGAAVGSLVDAAVGGGEIGGALGAGTAGVLGLAGGPVGAIAGMALQQLVSWIGGTIKQGMQNFQQTIPAFSQLSHALDNAKNSAVGFQENVQMAGARVAMMPVQSTQVAQTLVQAFGNSVGTKGIARLTQQAGANAILNGLDPQVQAAIMATSAGLGITNGVGSSMSPTQYNNMFLNMVQKSNMQGRQGPLATGLLSVYSQLGSVNPIITSANSTAAIYAQMNATGIQGLQGQSGANIINQANAALANPQGLTQIAAMAAVYQGSHGKITNPFQMESVANQGIGAIIPGTHTTVGAQLIKQAKMAGRGNIYNEAGYLANAAHISINDALEILKTGSWTATSISERSNQSTRLTVSEQNASASAKAQVVAGSLGALKSDLGNLGAKLAEGSTYVTSAGVAGNIYTGKFGNFPGIPKNNSALNIRIGQTGPSGSGSAASPPTFTQAILESIAYQESRGRIYAINDNSTGPKGIGTAYYPKTQQQYLNLANKLLAKHHQLALGPFQLESFHKGVTPASAINMNWAPEEALNVLLRGKNPSTMKQSDWMSALEHYGNNFDTSSTGYAQQVLNRANGYMSTPDSAGMNLSQATITAIGRAVGNAINEKLLTGAFGQWGIR